MEWTPNGAISSSEELAPKTNSSLPPSPVKSPDATVVSFQLVLSFFDSFFNSEPMCLPRASP